MACSILVLLVLAHLALRSHDCWQSLEICTLFLRPSCISAWSRFFWSPRALTLVSARGLEGVPESPGVSTPRCTLPTSEGGRRSNARSSAPLATATRVAIAWSRPSEWDPRRQRLRGSPGVSVGRLEPCFLPNAPRSHRFRCRCRGQDQMPLLAPLVHTGVAGSRGRGARFGVAKECTPPAWSADRRVFCRPIFLTHANLLLVGGPDSVA